MSAETLSEDLLLEIFVRLDLKSVQRFRAVCMHWQSLLTDPVFRKLWSTKRNLKPSTGLFVNSTSGVISDLLPFSTSTPITTLQPFKLKILQSCNGLLLCSSRHPYSYPYPEYHVYNPTTAACHTLPILGTGSNYNGNYKIMSITLAFDPANSSHYKVICFVQFNSDLRVRVYSSVTRTWKFLSETFFGQVDCEGVYWNGAIHWKDRSSYFDIKKEIFRIMPKVPGSGSWRQGIAYLGESCDHLNCAKLWKTKKGRDVDVYELKVDVYELKRDYSEWVLKCSVDLGDQYSAFSVLSLVHVLGEDDSFLVLQTGEGIIVRYNLVSATPGELRVLSTSGFSVTRFQYIESLWGV